MTARCTACGASGWHPDTRNCALPSCELRPRTAAETSPEASPLASGGGGASGDPFFHDSEIAA